MPRTRRPGRPRMRMGYGYGYREFMKTHHLLKNTHTQTDTHTHTHSHCNHLSTSCPNAVVYLDEFTARCAAPRRDATRKLTQKLMHSDFPDVSQQERSRAHCGSILRCALGERMKPTACWTNGIGIIVEQPNKQTGLKNGRQAGRQAGP